ncbi:HypC/HybG/HupF family hydrogenase formation chaperone [Amphibiibacter pelophylacis]|uniref:HypC/HybG/HupF family hydrogenase formation chaperone n=1 Tax=Amphibiibacter pelophylacis TaxID=1799477 RepID=A0ACC6P001_9BURK
MCIGIPMQVRELAPGRALCVGRGQERWISSLLVGDLAPGDWVLMFLDSAREVISPGRAAEVNAVLDLVEASMAPAGQDPHACADDGAGFMLPSRMSAHELARLTGA